jgi:hypothetical protein
MAYYRLYFLDGAHRIEQFREFELPNDMLAIRQAAEWRGMMAMELWCGPRKVRRWDELRSGGAAPGAPGKIDILPWHDHERHSAAR